MSSSNIELSWSHFKTFITVRSLEILMFEETTYYTLMTMDDSLIISCVILKDSGADHTEFDASYKANCNKAKKSKVEITDIPAFALPAYRTKNDATSAIVDISVNSSASADYLLTAERYVSGGEMIIKNAEFGDYVTAEVRDIDGAIPEAYRTALCEAYPTVAKYVEKRWVMPANAQGFSFCELDTRPLTAKVSAGLYLRLTYHAVNAGSTRSIVVNYHLTKKL